MNYNDNNNEWVSDYSWVFSIYFWFSLCRVFTFKVWGLGLQPRSAYSRINTVSDQIESIQKRALKIIFPSLCYEDALKKSGLILLRQRREDACITFLKRSYSSSDLLRSLVPRVVHTRPYALRTGESVFVPASSRTNRFGNFCTIKYQNHI